MCRCRWCLPVPCSEYLSRAGVSSVHRVVDLVAGHAGSGRGAQVDLLQRMGVCWIGEGISRIGIAAYEAKIASVPLIVGCKRVIVALIRRLVCHSEGFGFGSLDASDVWVVGERGLQRLVVCHSSIRRVYYLEWVDRTVVLIAIPDFALGSVDACSRWRSSAWLPLSSCAWTVS